MRNWKGLKKIIAGLLTVTLLFTSMNIEPVQGATATNAADIMTCSFFYNWGETANISSKKFNKVDGNLRPLQIRVFLDGKQVGSAIPNDDKYYVFDQEQIRMNIATKKGYKLESAKATRCYDEYFTNNRGNATSSDYRRAKDSFVDVKIYNNSIYLGLNEKGYDKDNKRSYLDLYFVTSTGSHLMKSSYSAYDYHMTEVKTFSLSSLIASDNLLNLAKSSTLNASVLNLAGLSGNDYEYSCVKIYDEITGTKATSIKNVNGKYYFTTDNTISDSSVWTEVDENDVYVIINLRDRLKSSSKTDTVDTRGLIDIATFNYNNKGADGYNDDASSINMNHNLYFWRDSAGTNKGNYNAYTNSEAIYKGIVQNNLVNGYPALNRTVTDSSESLAYLFDKTGTSNGLEAVVADASYLFSYDANSRRYSFDSSQNEAILDVNSGDFTVYNRSNQDFFPYWRTGSATSDDKFSFGMNVGFDFLQPRDGKIDDNAMTFDFSGDDDVWVFVDGVLVLDIGGIHGTAGAHINFATGAVTYDGGRNNTYNTTLYDLFETAGKTDAQLEDIFTDAKIFKNYTNHHLEMFYMERGAGKSNCKVQFNLPIIARGALSVSKEVTAADKIEFDTTKEYSFRLYTGTTATNKTLVTNRSYDVYFNGVDTGIDGTIGTDGVFKLKDGQTAVFNNIVDGIHYHVEEVDPGENYRVLIGATELANINGAYASSDYTFDLSTSNAITYTNFFTGSNEEYNKTASVKDEEERVFELDLSATMKGSEFISNKVVENQPLDMILVLDASSSMYYPGDLQSIGTMTPGTAASQYAKEYSAGRIFTFSNDGYPYQLKYRNNDGYVMYDTLQGKSHNIIDKDNREFFVSGYGTDSYKDRVTIVKETIDSTIEELQKHKGSSLAVFAFNSTGYTILNAKAVDELTESDIETIKETYSNTLAGYTNPSEGLKLAKTELSKMKNTAKYVVMITDGCPTGTKSKNAYNEIVAAKNEASAIENMGAKLVSIGIDLQSIQDKKISGGNGVTINQFLNAISSTGADGKELTYTIETSGLVDLMKQIVKESSEQTVVSHVLTAEVRDYIDDRFEIVAENEDGSYTTVTSGSAYDGSVYFDADKGLYYISWKDAELDGWNKKILVKAKKDFFGGNAVFTNGASSGIYVDGTIKYEFTNPLVNVKTLDITDAEDEETFFIQDEVTPLAYFKDNSSTLFDGIPSGCDLTSTEVESVLAGNTVEKAYVYSDFSNDGTLGVFRYTRVNDDYSTHILNEVGYHVETYRVKVEFIPTEINDRLSDLNRGESSVVGSAALSKTATTTYYVNVVEGQIDIVKKLVDNTKYSKEYEGDPIFTFKIDKYSDAAHRNKVATFYRTVRFNDAGMKKVDAEALSHLGRGYYVVTELTTQRYENVNKANSVEITFVQTDIENLGTLTEASKNLTITKGATVTNRKKDETGKQTDTDVVMNRYEKDANGVWHVVAVTVPQNTNEESQKTKEVVNKEFALLPTKSEKKEGNN